VVMGRETNSLPIQYKEVKVVMNVLISGSNILRHEHHKISNKAKVLYHYFCTRADNKHHTCFPSNRKICEDTAISLASIKRAKNELYREGLLKREFRYRGNNSQTSNLYTVAVKASEFMVFAKEMAMTKIEESLLMLYYMRRALKQKEQEMKDYAVVRLSQVKEEWKDEVSERILNSISSYMRLSEPYGALSEPPITFPI
jgi:hypothetical protein